MQHKYPTIQFFVTIIWFLFDIISRYNHQVVFFRRKQKKKRSIILIPILTMSKKFSILTEVKTVLRVSTSLLGHGTGKVDPRTMYSIAITYT